MKLKLMTAGAAMSLLLLSACGGSAPEGKSAADAGLKNVNDSVSYYMGMSMAGLYNQMTMSDTTLKTEAARKEMLKAFGEAMNTLQGKSDAEINGYLLALQAVMTGKQVEEQVDVKFNSTLFANGLSYAINSDSIAGKSAEGNQMMQPMMMRLQTAKSDKLKAAGAKALAAYVKKGYTKVSDNLYMKSVKAGNGAQLKDGDKVKLKMTAKDGKGNEINVPMPEKAQVGQLFMGSPMEKSFSQMKMGETAEFVTGAIEMFQNPQQMKQMGIDPEGLIVFTIEVLGPDTESATPAAPSEAKVAPAAVKAVPADAKAAPAPAAKK